MEEKTYAEIRQRQNVAVSALTSEADRSEVREADRMAMAYAWGWQDATNAERDTVQTMAFGHAYGTVAALNRMARCGRPNIADAWQSWRKHGHIMDWLGGSEQALDLIDPTGR